MAVAALEEGVVTEHTSYYCPGSFGLPGVKHRWACWRKHLGGHHDTQLLRALYSSCDVYFYNVGLKLGVEKITKWSQLMGLGVPSGLDIPPGVEVTGISDYAAYKRKTRSHLDRSEQKWYPGDTVSLSIGQGYATITPLQGAVMMACVLNGGKRVRPFLNQALGPDVTQLPISEKTLQLVQQGMQLCVERTEVPSGTGKEARIPGMVILGKTGTAQVMRLQKKGKEKIPEDQIPYNERDHAWFVAGRLDGDPPIAVCVFVAHGLHGSSTAAPLAREVIKHFYENPPPDLLLAQAAEDAP